MGQTLQMPPAAQEAAAGGVGEGRHFQTDSCGPREGKVPAGPGQGGKVRRHPANR